MRKLAVALLTAVSLPWSAFAEVSPSTPSQVTLPLAQYDELRDVHQRPSATVIDTIRLGGTFRGRDLTIIISGRSVGQRPVANIIDKAKDVTISGCKGAAIVNRTTKGAFALIPVADAFEVKCDLRLSGSDRLAMHVLPTVLDVQASVGDGELVAGDEDDDGGRHYSLVRQVATTGVRMAATATGRYRITLLPDASRFHYTIDVRNPNRSTSTLSLALVSDEHLQQIDSAAPYEVDGTRFTFTIPPGDSSIQMSGEIRGSSFRAPVDASLQYLVLESHPLIRPLVNSSTKRVSIAETGMTPQYRGALGFETGSQQITWKTKRLEALRAISYAAKSAHHRLFVPLDGQVLGESGFQIRNEGAAEIILPQQPEPTFVSLQNEPVFMTRDQSGRLTVPLSTGEQSVLVQHRQTYSKYPGLGAGRILLPQLEVPTSNTHVTMTYPREWIPLYESFATRSVLWMPDFAMLLLFAAMTFWIERVLGWLGLPLRRRLAVALMGALASAIVTPFLAVVVVSCSAITIAWLSTLPIRARVASAAAVIGVGLFFMVVIISMLSVSSREGPSEYASSAPLGAVTDTSIATDTSMSGAEPAPARRADMQPQPAAYQGLPARFDLPSGSRHTSFEQELLPTERRHSVFVVTLSMLLVKWIGLLIALITLLVLGRDRRTLAASLRSRMPEGRTVPEPPPEAEQESAR